MLKELKLIETEQQLLLLLVLLGQAAWRAPDMDTAQFQETAGRTARWIEGHMKELQSSKKIYRLTRRS